MRKPQRFAPLIGAALGGLLVVLMVTCSGPDDYQAARLSGGGGNVLTGGGGLAKVTNTGGILSGSGTPSNPETATITTKSPLTGTGSSGNALGVAVETNSAGILAGSGSSGDKLTVTLTVTNPISGTGSSGSPLAAAVTTNSPGLLSGSGSSGSPLVASLSVTSPVAGTGSSGNPLSFSTTTTSCSNGQGVTSIGATAVGTCGNVGRNAYAGTHFEWIDDQIGGVANARTVEGFTTTLTSGTVSTNGTTTRPGIIDYNVAAATPTRAGEISSPQLIDFGSGNWTYDWVGGFPTLSTSSDEYVAEMGFIDVTTGINPADGCWFDYDRGNSAASGPNSGNTAALSCWCASNSVVTTYLINGSGNSDESFALGTLTVAALTLPDTNIMHLRIIMTGTTRAEFYAVKGAGSLTKVCDINTHIPSGSARVTGAGFLVSKTVGSTLRAMSVDFVGIAVDLTAARTN